MKKVLLMSFALVLGSLILLSFTNIQQQKAKPWQVPDKYVKMKNAKTGDAAATAKGKELWGKFCKSCHGATGKGDGAKAASLKTFPGDFTAKEFKGMSDGEIYYKSFIGRDEMPNFEKKVTDEGDRWGLVNYMRTLK
jgi:mono/diheme cytochrome c family protein